MNKDITNFTKLIECIGTLENISNNKDVFWKTFFHPDKIKSSVRDPSLKILILNTPCNGFGDVVFSMKISNYLKEWYDCNVTIATTDPDAFLKLGETSSIVKLAGRNSNAQCRRFKYLKMLRNISEQDLIFVAPMQSDYAPSLQDVRYLIPYANKFNTFFFSEYNHIGEEDTYDFPTGVGEDKYGLLLVKTTNKVKRIPSLKNKYALVYIAESIDESEACFLAFVEMISAKYNKKHKHLDIVIPTAIDYFLEDYLDKIIKKVGKYYPTIMMKNKKGEVSTLYEKGGSSDKVLMFRLDILPVPYFEMIGLIENSIQDILLTGDQSITDALACCYDKNIWYQQAGWKEGFAKNLAKYMPNKYLSDYETSCGTLKAIKFKSNYKKFVEDWDFSKLARPKLNAIIESAIFKINNRKIIEEIEDIIASSKTLHTLQTKIAKYFE